jgi:NAD(P)-dependent dehydrogenase (short-subunit alcohol dehydrogenase family)
MREYWIFGSSKPLGLGLSKALSGDNKVVCFSRTVPVEAPDTVPVDFADTAATRTVIKTRLSPSSPDGAIFCQRYRPSAGQSDLEAVKAGLDVELAPVLALIEEARAQKRVRPLSIVLISSVAGQNAHVDIPLYYHLLKTVTLMATKTLATAHASENIRVNCIVLGEFEKYDRAGYTDREKIKFETLEAFTSSRRLCGIADIANTAAFLLSDKAAYISGQTINLDGNLSNISQESIIRTLAAKQGG